MARPSRRETRTTFSLWAISSEAKSCRSEWSEMRVSRRLALPVGARLGSLADVAVVEPAAERVGEDESRLAVLERRLSERDNRL